MGPLFLLSSIGQENSNYLASETRCEQADLLSQQQVIIISQKWKLLLLKIDVLLSMNWFVRLNFLAARLVESSTTTWRCPKCVRAGFLWFWSWIWGQKGNDGSNKRMWPPTYGSSTIFPWYISLRFFLIPWNEEAIERPPLSRQRWYLGRNRGVALSSTTPLLL